MSSIIEFLIVSRFATEGGAESLLLYASNERRLIKPFRRVIHNRTKLTKLSSINQTIRA